MPARLRASRRAPILGAGLVLAALALGTAVASAQVPDLPVPTPTPVPSVLQTPEGGLDLPVDVNAPTEELGDDAPVDAGKDGLVPQSSFKEWTREDGTADDEGGGRGAPDSGSATTSTRVLDRRPSGSGPRGSGGTAADDAAPYPSAAAGSIADTFRRAVSLAEPAALPLSLSVLALLLLGIAARGPGRLAKVEEDAGIDRDVFRL